MSSLESTGCEMISVVTITFLACFIGELLKRIGELHAQRRTGDYNFIASMHSRMETDYV